MTEVHQLPDDHFACTEATVQHMIRLAREGAHDPRIIQLARTEVSHVPDKDYLGELRAVYNLVRETVRYVRDPRNLELLATPAHVALTSGSGDCDEHAVLLAAMSLALGHHAAFRCVKGNPAQPEHFTHVYALLSPATDPNGWRAADTTEKGRHFGWDPAQELRLDYQDWEVG